MGAALLGKLRCRPGEQNGHDGAVPCPVHLVMLAVNDEVDVRIDGKLQLLLAWPWTSVQGDVELIGRMAA